MEKLDYREFNTGDTVKVYDEFKGTLHKEKYIVKEGMFTAFMKINGAPCDFKYILLNKKSINKAIENGNLFMGIYEIINSSSILVRAKEMITTRIVLTEKTIDYGKFHN